MKYMLLIYTPEQDWTPEEYEACLGESTRLCEELATAGKFYGASPLRPVEMATSVRVRQGQKHVTDGPFAETTEQLGGYFLIEAENLDEAIAVASRIPGAKKGTVEVRPVMQLEKMPQVAAT